MLVTNWASVAVEACAPRVIMPLAPRVAHGELRSHMHYTMPQPHWITSVANAGVTFYIRYEPDSIEKVMHIAETRRP